MSTTGLSITFGKATDLLMLLEDLSSTTRTKMNSTRTRLPALSSSGHLNQCGMLRLIRYNLQRDAQSQSKLQSKCLRGQVVDPLIATTQVRESLHITKTLWIEPLSLRRGATSPHVQ
jgi:hypothetical protein